MVLRILSVVQNVGKLMIALVIVHVSACSLPVHLSQSPQILVYSQRYTLCHTQKELRARLIEELFGVPSSKALPDKDIERVLVHGSLYLRLASVPGDPSAFMIEGHGWHRMYYGHMDNYDSFRYLAAADYQISDDGPIPFSELERGSLTIRVSVINKAVFTKPIVAIQKKNYVFIHLYTAKIADGIYTVSHDREHEIGWRVSSNGSRAFVQIIGYMQLIGMGDGRNLVDVRGVEFVSSDYPALMAGKLDVPRRHADVPVIEWIPARRCRDSEI